ncbi:MAG: peptidylprolyl isomerase [Vicinamibacteria bacterium]
MTSNSSASTGLKKLMREPLAHFVLLGAGLFAWSALWGQPGTRNERIVVTEAHVSRLIEIFGRTWQRPPTERELQGLVDEHIKEEILYREALAMGLDRDDTIIRRRLRQKMEFLYEDLAAQNDPADEELEAYLAEHVERFRIEGPLSFAHVYISIDRRGDKAIDDAKALLARLNRDPEASGDVASLGDRLPLPSGYESTTASDIAKMFGRAFAERVSGLPIGEWSGPVESGYGLHLVRVSERSEDRLPELAEVREAVTRDWRVREREQTNDELFRQLREKYHVVVEFPLEGAKSGSEAAELSQ